MITADAVVNVILYALLGAVLALVGWRWRRALLAGALLSAVIELAQSVIPGRDASIFDVLFNAVGIALARSSAWWLRPGDLLEAACRWRQLSSSSRASG